MKRHRARVRLFSAVVIFTVSLGPILAQQALLAAAAQTGPGGAKPFSPGSGYLSPAGYARRVAIELAPTGRLRVAIAMNPTLMIKNPTTGELRGIGPDMARELAQSLRIPLTWLEMTLAKTVDTANTNTWDIAFLAISPARAATMDFSDAYLQLDNTYLVPAGSRISTVADADQPGVRIGVNRSSLSDSYLSGALKRATLVRSETSPASLALLRAGQLDAMAGERSALLEFRGQLPGSRVLNDRYLVLRQAIALPKGRPDAVRYVRAFVEHAKSSGFVKRAIERAGVRGVEVAPPATP
jgi:polar amino acid transport system substrate-binding protein